MLLNSFKFTVGELERNENDNLNERMTHLLKKNNNNIDGWTRQKKPLQTVRVFSSGRV